MFYILLNDTKTAWVAINKINSNTNIDLERGFVVEEIPIANPPQNMQPILRYDKERGLYYEYMEKKKTKEEIQSELNAKLLKDNANMQIELDKQKQLNSTLLLKIAELGGNANA